MSQNANRMYETTYNRAAATVGVVHIGFGNFHRAHQAVYFDDFMQKTGDLGWGIAAVNLRPDDTPLFNRVATGTGYALKITSPQGDVAVRLVRSHLEFHDWVTAPDAAEALLARPGVKLVTATVTESGYYLDEQGALDTAHTVIAAEMQNGPSTSVYAYLANGLARRMAVGGGPITILCCDNMRSNGKTLQRNLDTYLRASDRSTLADWLRANASFPCSMVDRITPRPAADLAAEISALTGRETLAPINSESYIQWVIEDRFAGLRPDLARVGAELVAHVDPYEEAKIRILNGGHSALAYLGGLAGHKTFDQAMQDPALRPHFDAWERENVLPALPADLPFDKAAYLAKVVERFCNAVIADTLERICMDGCAKFRLFIVPTLADCLSQGVVPTHGYTTIASWFLFSRRFASGELDIEYQEPGWHMLEPLLAPGRERDFAKCTSLWGNLPAEFPGFVPGVLAAIEAMEAQHKRQGPIDRIAVA